MPQTCFYRGTVTHTRLLPFRHQFAYRVFSALFDLDTVQQQSRKSWLFSHNRWNILAFFDRDHGARDGSSPRAWIDGILRTNGYAPDGWRVWLHCFPRLFGYVFNPLSIYFCYDAAGVLRVILYDVRNTFGDKHGYLIPVTESEGPIRQTCAKGFHVSPFFPVEGAYRFDLMPPDARYTARISLEAEGKPQFFAKQTGERRPFSDREIIKLVARHPLMTLKIIGAIHWEALWIWRKGARFYGRPTPPKTEVTAIIPIDPPTKLVRQPQTLAG